MKLPIVWVCLLTILPGPGADFVIHTVDGLNRPLPGVEVEVFCSPGSQIFKFQSDQDGVVQGSYDPAECKPTSVAVRKPGYSSYLSGFRERYELLRQYGAEDVERIVALNGDSQLSELRELLAGDSRLEASIFYNEARVRAPLRTLARDPNVTLAARRLLALIAVPEDLDFVLHLPDPPKALPFPERWRYRVATALVNPQDEEEWSFLERCASNEFRDGWVDAGAIQSLRLTASARSQRILEAAQRKNTAGAAMISEALEYVRSNPEPFVGRDLEALARRTALALRIGVWKGDLESRLNRAGDKALIDLTFEAGLDRYTYTATFHYSDGVWSLRGAHETLQALMAR